jgi:hypothetical protein
MPGLILGGHPVFRWDQGSVRSHLTTAASEPLDGFDQR